VGSTSKDSSIDGPGQLSALVAAVAFVDETGALRRASLDDDPQLLAQITCAYGLMGVVVEASLLTRAHTLVRTVMTMHPVPRSAPGARAAAVLSEAREGSDNVFAIMHPLRDTIYVERRWLVPNRTRVPFLITAVNLALLGTPKADCFKRGRPLSALLAPVVSANRHMGLYTDHRRHGFTNSYAPVTAREDRLDFSYFEFDATRLDEVVSGCWELAAEHQRRTGFCPNGFAVYFVKRPGGKLAGSYTGAAGASFMLDPIHSDPEDPRWRAFNEAYALWAVALGANVSLSQTKGLPASPELGGALPASLARERFVTPFFRPFLVDDVAFEKEKSYARPAGDDHPRRAAMLAEYRRLLDQAANEAAAEGGGGGAAAAGGGAVAGEAAVGAPQTPPAAATRPWTPPQAAQTYVGRFLFSLGLAPLWAAASSYLSADSDATASTAPSPSAAAAPSPAAAKA